LATVTRLALELVGEEPARGTCLSHFEVWMVDRQFRCLKNFRGKMILGVMEGRFLASENIGYCWLLLKHWCWSWRAFTLRYFSDGQFIVAALPAVRLRYACFALASEERVIGGVASRPYFLGFGIRGGW
jgi:hypothetical protein